MKGRREKAGRGEGRGEERRGEGDVNMYTIGIPLQENALQSSIYVASSLGVKVYFSFSQEARHI